MINKFILVALSFILTTPLNAQWIWTNGPYGGRMQSMTSIGTNLLVSTYGSGIFLSSDSGQTWNRSNNGLPADAFYNTSQLAANSSYILAGGSYGLYKSNDFGLSWNLVIQNPIHGLMLNDSAIIISSTGTSDNISISYDNGLMWSSFPQGSFLATNFALVGSLLYVGTNYDGLYTMDLDSGVWNSIPGFPDEITGLYADEDYILTSSVNSTYLSRDSALTWIQDASVNSRGPFFHFANRYFSGGAGLIALDTLTNAWNPIGNFQSERITSFASIGNIFYMGADGRDGLYSSVDSGITWHITNTGITNVFSISNLYTDGPNIIADDCPGFAVSFDVGATWDYVDAGGSNYPCDLPPVYAMKDSLILSIVNGGLAHSLDTGKSWSSINNGLSTIYSLAIDGNNFWVGTEQGLFISTNSGATWTPRNTGMSNLIVHSIQISGQNIYAGAKTSQFGQLTGIYYSSDYGLNWSSSNVGIPPNCYLSKITLMGSIAFVAIFDEGIFKSDNNGFSWTLISNWATNDKVSVAVTGTNLFIASTFHGVYLSHDTGQSWTSIQQNLLRAPEQLASSSTYLFAAVPETGIWKRSLANILLSIGETTIASKVVLSPNPASNKLLISVLNYVPKRIMIEMINLSGAKVYSLDVGDAGLFFSKEIDLTNIDKGFYIMSIREGNGNILSREKFVVQR